MLFAAAMMLCCSLMLWACTEPSSTLPPSLSDAPPSVPERLGPGDELEIRVYGESEMSGPFQVQDDGSIDFPLLKRIEVAGMTQSELSKVLRDKLAAGYLLDPSVTVRVVARQNLEVSVLGAVERAGSFPWMSQMTLAQAVSLAGGLKEIAQSRRIRVTRRGPSGPVTFEVSMKAITEGRADDIELQPGDIVFVPESPV